MTRWIWIASLALLVLAGPATAQKRKATCPWCKDDPELLKALSAVSHAPQPVGTFKAEEAKEKLEENGQGEWLFLETPHFRFASSLGSQSLNQKDREKLAKELEYLESKLPKFSKKVRKLDPWLRLHLLAMRTEQFYSRFQTLLGVTDADFPESRSADGPYMGNGRYLGEKEKFDLVLHSDRRSHEYFTQDQNGVRVTDAMRWHCIKPHKLIASLPAVDSDLRQDKWLFPHIVHNVSHMCLAAYKHFSYDPPIWLDEGLAHVLEREAEPDSWTREGEEGTYKERGRSSDWTDDARKLVAKGRAPSLAVLMRKHTIGELSTDDHVTCWSMVRFLLQQHPGEFSLFIGGIKGQLDSRGYPSGSDLPGLQRKLMRELWDWSPADFDAAWQSWVKSE